MPTPLDHFDPPEAETPAPAAAPRTPVPERTGDAEIDSLLDEFRATPAPKPGADSEPTLDEMLANPEPPPREPTKLEEQIGRLGDAYNAEWRQEVERWAQGIDRERWLAREKADNDVVLAKVREIAEDVAPHLAGDTEMLGGWLLSQYLNDPKLRHAWDNRHADGENGAAAYHCEKRVEKLMRKFAKHLKSLPDPVASADKAAVAAAVRGASVSEAPKPKPVDYKSMSNTDFANEIEKKHGFRPNV